MPRPKRERQVNSTPTVTYFKPRGVPLMDLEEVRLAVEGLEAIRLADDLGLTQTEAAQTMGVSRHTFGRVLAEARQAVARALVGGRALRIEGGHWVFGQNPPPLCGRAAGKVCAPGRGPNDPEVRAESLED